MEKKRRSAIQIMGQLILFVKPLLHIMLLAILLGTAGYLCAIFLTILAGKILVWGMESGVSAMGVSIRNCMILMAVLAVMRGILHYAEQYCNHFIAFKLLAIIRHKVFAVLRKLCPAKLEGRDKGNLISIITTDIELLEVFYAHTISPIAIAVLTSACMVVFLARYHWLAGIYALAAYLVVGVLIPLWNGKKGGEIGMQFRSGFGKLNGFVLSSLRGMEEILQYDRGETRRKEMEEKSSELGKLQFTLSKQEGHQRAATNGVILVASIGMFLMMTWLNGKGQTDFEGVLLSTIAMMGSFGPVVALASLSNNLNQTLASGERVLSLMEEKPMVEEVLSGDSEEVSAENCTEARFCDVSFSYGKEEILKHYNLHIAPGKITGIHGRSGCGKSTILKLLMRFWDVGDGEIRIGEKDVRHIETAVLREAQSFVTQETDLFHDSIANNIAIGKPGASREEIEEAAKKASLHEFILSLPNGYDTEVGELGDTLSGGEKQRIGIARVFLHNAPFILLDEPTSNLDSLNEGIILKSLKECSEGKTIVLVSHRESTMKVADVIENVYEV